LTAELSFLYLLLFFTAQAEMSEVTSQQFTKSGNTTVRVFNVALSKDVQPHLVVSTVVLLTLLLDQ